MMYNKNVIAWVYLYISENYEETCPIKIIYNIHANVSCSFEEATALFDIVIFMITNKTLFKDDISTVDFITNLFNIIEHTDINVLYEKVYSTIENNLIDKKDIVLNRNLFIAVSNIKPIYEKGFKLMSEIVDINLL